MTVFVPHPLVVGLPYGRQPTTPLCESEDGVYAVLREYAFVPCDVRATRDAVIRLGAVDRGMFAPFRLVGRPGAVWRLPRNGSLAWTLLGDEPPELRRPK